MQYQHIRAKASTHKPGTVLPCKRCKPLTPSCLTTPVGQITTSLGEEPAFPVIQYQMEFLLNFQLAWTEIIPAKLLQKLLTEIISH